ncbi:MAG TPA: hypothetical protein PLB41_14870, partial [Rubrivivax sp.]|nr:hypothetical protein [Rubrivivax sp.]
QARRALPLLIGGTLVTTTGALTGLDLLAAAGVAGYLAGIGLTIAQQAAARHGGTIRAEAGPGPGASFHVALRDLALPAQERARDNTETRAA